MRIGLREKVRYDFNNPIMANMISWLASILPWQTRDKGVFQERKIVEKFEFDPLPSR